MKYKQQYLSAKYMSLLQRNPSREIKQTYHKGNEGQTFTAPSCSFLNLSKGLIRVSVTLSA